MKHHRCIVARPALRAALVASVSLAAGLAASSATAMPVASPPDGRAIDPNAVASVAPAQSVPKPVAKPVAEAAVEAEERATTPAGPETGTAKLDPVDRAPLDTETPDIESARIEAPLTTGAIPNAEPAAEMAAEPETGVETETPDTETAEIPGSPDSDTAPSSDDVAAALEAAISADNGLDAAVATFYASRDFRPLWLGKGKLNASARRIIERLGRADLDGLDPTRYATPRLDVGEAGIDVAALGRLDAAGSDPRSAALAKAELDLTAAALRFAHDAQFGTFEPESLGKFTTPKRVRPKTAAVLAGLADADDRAAYLDGFNPPHPQFKALQALLEDLRGRDPADVPPPVPAGPSMKPGKTDERLPALRARLGLPAVEGDAALIYDAATVEAVEAFQTRASLDVDGVVGPQTLAALNGGTEVTVEDVLVNMERWRWVPRDMGDLNVWVNIPEFRLRVVADGEPFFETRVIVGTKKNQTPIFSDKIEYVDVNPYWNVPRSIAAKEMMPEIRQDPSFFARRGLEVIYTGGGREVVIDPRSVDWTLWNPETMPFRFRQPPGGANALGRVKFMFPNKHAVYLHDTPTRNLFARSVRSFSHGCVRVDKPVEFADALLAREEQLNGQRIKNLIGGGDNGAHNLKRHVPVHLTYFTVWVDEAGETQKRADLYDYDSRMKAAMELGG